MKEYRYLAGRDIEANHPSALTVDAHQKPIEIKTLTSVLPEELILWSGYLTSVDGIPHNIRIIAKISNPRYIFRTKRVAFH
jgi:hypothetical protein